MQAQCCFCGKRISDSQAPVDFSIDLEDGGTQGLSCHPACLTAALHPSVPTAYRGGLMIMMPLMNEGTPVWRPVSATKVDAGTYEISDSVVVPDEEEWAFGPGTTVTCELRTLSDGGVHLVAMSKVE